MASFKDASGRVWSLVITVDTIRRVRQLAGCDLMQAIGGKLLEQLAVDPVLLVDVLAAACKPQMDAAQVTAEQFGQAMVGDAIDDAAQALLQGLADFSPSPTRKLLLRLIEAGRAGQAKAHELAMAAMDRMQEPQPGAASPSQPASSASTPAG